MGVPEYLSGGLDRVAGVAWTRNTIRDRRGGAGTMVLTVSAVEVAGNVDYEVERATTLIETLAQISGDES
jgi:hypothetical protein